MCDCAVYVCSKYYIRWINRGTVWKVVHKPWSWTFLENFYIYAWPFIHCLCFSNTHKNCIAVKLHLYKCWLEGREVIKGAGVLRMPLHHSSDTHSSSQHRCKTTLRCQLPYIPPPFFKVKSLKYPSKKVWFSGIYWCFVCNSPGLTDCTTAGKIVDVTDKVRVQGSTTATSNKESFR